jgi:hypothetical protein
MSYIHEIKCEFFTFNHPCSYFFYFFFANMVLLKVVHPLKIYHHSNFHGSKLTGESSIQKFERSPFWNGWSYGIKNYGVEVTFNGMTFLPTGLIKANRGQTNRLTNTQTGKWNHISLLFSLLSKNESRLIKSPACLCPTLITSEPISEF